MTTAPELHNQSQRIACSAVWGGIEPVRLDTSTKGITISLYSSASGGERGGDIYYMSVCSHDLRTRMFVADVRGHGEQVSEISSWICQSLRDKINSVDCAGVLSDLNQMVRSRGFAAITTAAVVSHDISNSRLYYAYAGHPPILARRSGGPWLPLVVKRQSGQANLPLGVLGLVHYDQGEARVQAGDRILLYTDGLSEAMRPESEEEFGDRELLTLLEAQAKAGLAGVRDSLIEAATTFSGGPDLKDDCTVVAAEVL